MINFADTRPLMCGCCWDGERGTGFRHGECSQCGTVTQCAVIGPASGPVTVPSPSVMPRRAGELPRWWAAVLRGRR